MPTVSAPTSKVSAADISAPYAMMAQSSADAAREVKALAGATASDLNDLAKRKAKDAGLEAVTRDENGNIQIERAPIVGDAAIEYANAVKIAAVAEGEKDAKMRNIELRTKYENDPDSYLKAAEAYKGEALKTFQAAGTQAQFALGKAIDNLTTETYGGLVSRKQTRDLTRATQSITTQIQSLENELYALANGGDTASPEYTRRVADIRGLYGELTRNPRLNYPADRAEFELKQIESNLKATATARVISKNIYDKEGPEAALKAAEEIRTDPKLNLTPQQRDSYYTKAVGEVNQRMRADLTADKAVAAEIQDVNKIASEGYKPTDQRMADLRQTVAASKNPEIVKMYEASVENMPTIATWRQMSPAQLETELNNLNRTMREKGATEQSIALRATGEKLLTTMRKEVAADPLGWAERTGVASVPMIDFAAPTAAQDMRGRIAAAEVVAAQYRIAPSYLRPEERRFLEVSTAAGGKTMIDTANMLVQGFGDRSSRVLAEVSKDAPVLAHTGGLLSGGLFGGGSPVFVNDVADAITLKQNKDFKLPRWLDHPSDKILTAQNAKTRDLYGDAFHMVPDNGRAAEASAQAAYFSRANRRGYSALVDDSNSETAYKRALQEGAGATFAADGTQFGGVTAYKPGYWTNYKVLVPGNIRTDRFKDVIGAIKDDDLSRLPISPQGVGGKNYTARDLQSGVPVAVPGGYRFAQGDPTSDDPKWVRGADGRPFVLNVEALEPELRKRVPGAFNSGSR